MDAIVYDILNLKRSIINNKNFDLIMKKEYAYKLFNW